MTVPEPGEGGKWKSVLLHTPKVEETWAIP